MSQHIETLKQRLIDAEKRGAPIISFIYHGKRRNAQCNTFAARPTESHWGQRLSNCVIVHGGKTYVKLQENNIDGHGHQVKTFDLSKMTDLQGV